MQQPWPLQPTFLSFDAGVGEEPGARGGEDGGHAEFSSAGFARGDLRRRLRLASVGTGTKETSRETASNQQQRRSVLSLNVPRSNV